MRNAQALRLSVLLAALALFVGSSHGHEVRPTQLEIFHIANGENFMVVDPTGCKATLTAVVSDPTIAEVLPDRTDPVVQQTFLVMSKKAGQTTIRVGWQGSGAGCTDNGSAEVKVTVKTGPDLALNEFLQFGTSDADHSALTKVRLGTEVNFRFSMLNHGDFPSTGTITVTSTVAPGFALILPSRTCPGTLGGGGQSYQCDITDSVPAGGVLALEKTPYLRVEAVQEGIWGNRGDVRGGGDIRFTNNSSNNLVLDVAAARAPDRKADQAPKNVNGRSR